MQPRPELIFLAGPNGAGKTTFYEAYLKRTGLPFINADQLALAFRLSDAEAAQAADRLREDFLDQKTSFMSETVFSDPVGAKLAYLRRAMDSGFRLRLIFIGIPSPTLSASRVAGRVRHGGHDVPTDRLERRYHQSLKNLAAALEFVDEALVIDNSTSANPYQLVLRTRAGRLVSRADPLPAWLASVVPGWCRA